MRRKVKTKRKLNPDPIYNSVLISKFINLLMKNGKKSLSKKIVYSLLTKLEEEHEKPGLQIFEEALDKARPTVALKARRVGGSNFQVPVAIEKEKGLNVAMRWVISIARSKKGAPIMQKLFKEINDILADQGDVLKKRDDTHRMAEANKAFSHFR